MGERIDVVTTMDGLPSFALEYRRAVKIDIGGGTIVKVLPLERIIHSKRTANRPKDRAALHLLEMAAKVIKARKGP